MKFITSLLFLLAPAMASVADERDLQIADWHVTITAVTSQGFTFETGLGGGTNPHIEIHVTDMCRLEGATRHDAGSFYPTSNVVGIDADGGGIVANPGPGNSIDWSFVESINGNTALYTDNGDQTATVEFCVLVGLYEGTVLIDYAETKMTYTIDLVTNIPELTGYTVTQAEAFDYDGAQVVAFDGTLLAYFCDPATKAILTDNGAKTHQGSILNVCFKVTDGQFEVSDIMDFTVSNAGAAEPSQMIITNSAPASTLYSTKECIDVDGTDENVCMVSFLLKADFYDFSALTLTGTGSVLLEFGNAAGIRRRLRRKLVVDPVEETFQVEAQEFQIEQAGETGSSASSIMTSFAAFGAIAGAAMVL